MAESEHQPHQQKAKIDKVEKDKKGIRTWDLGVNIQMEWVGISTIFSAFGNWNSNLAPFFQNGNLTGMVFEWIPSIKINFFFINDSKNNYF